MAFYEGYNEHYDATAAKGLCWDNCGRPQAVSTVIVDGKPMNVESLWCVECQAAEGWIQDADGQVN